MMSKLLADIDAKILWQTPSELLLAPDGDETKSEWVPKIAVEDNGDGTFTMPEKLAIEKGFV